MVNIKTCLLGDGYVGKTSIKRTFVGLSIKSDYSPTAGAEFSIKSHQYDYLDESKNKSLLIRYIIYDLAGQPRYKSIRSQYMKGSHAALLVYDVTSRESFDNILNWLKQFKQVISEDVPLVIVGNKIDLRDEIGNDIISSEEGEKLFKNIKEKYSNKKHNNIFFIETSAKNNTNIDKLFDLVSHFVYEEYIEGNPYV